MIVFMVGLSYGARNVLSYTRHIRQNVLAIRDTPIIPLRRLTAEMTTLSGSNHGQSSKGYSFSTFASDPQSAFNHGSEIVRLTVCLTDLPCSVVSRVVLRRRRKDKSRVTVEELHSLEFSPLSFFLSFSLHSVYAFMLMTNCLPSSPHPPPHPLHRSLSLHGPFLQSVAIN